MRNEGFVFDSPATDHDGLTERRRGENARAQQAELGSLLAAEILRLARAATRIHLNSIGESEATAEADHLTLPLDDEDEPVWVRWMAGEGGGA